MVTENDIPAIIEVLKAGLGEESSQKTERVWRYKHMDNPFGKSLVLVAEKEGKITGVRAFMQWRWQRGKKVYKAYRAVDTATHPDYQRQGIFKKLTLQALQIAKGRGGDLVFNTPNENSRPGYLKMGWKVIDKLQLSLVPSFFYLKYAFFSYKPVNHRGDMEALYKNYNEKMAQSGKLYTPKSVAYLKWRYENNPIIDYQIIQDKDFFLAYYIKYHRYFKELRISELIMEDKNALEKRLKKILVKEALKNKVFFISFSNESLFKMKIFGKFGPVLTVKRLNLSEIELREMQNISFWNYSLGDLELF